MLEDYPWIVNGATWPSDAEEPSAHTRYEIVEILKPIEHEAPILSARWATNINPRTIYKKIHKRLLVLLVLVPDWKSKMCFSYRVQTIPNASARFVNLESGSN